jgi:hypothetical protein
VPHPIRVLAALLATAASALAPSAARAAEPRPFVDLESGLAWAGRNDVRVPGDGGSDFSLAEGSLGTDAAPFVRVKGGVGLGRHTISFVFAPLRLRGSGELGSAVDFAGRSFSGDVAARYRLDTYRLTYRYTLVERPAFDLALGATVLVRDAEIRLTSGGVSARKVSLGVLPLASFRAAWRFAGPFALSLDGDALAVPQGRAEDVALSLELASGDLTFRAGYRLLEGGVDSDSVYNIALVHHLVAGVTCAF